MISLTGLQADFRGSGRRKPRAFGAAALVCLALLALLTVAQVAHTHPADRDADRCPLCIAMRSAAPAAAIAATVVLVRIQAAPRVFEARAVIRHWHPKLFTRPPPIGC
jgi:hypothetical protein